MNGAVLYASAAAFLLSVNACGAVRAQIEDAGAIDGNTVPDATTPDTATMPDAGAADAYAYGYCMPASDGGAECGTGVHCEDGTCVADVGVSANASRFYGVDLGAPEALIPLTGGAFHDAFVTGENLVFIGTYAPDSSHLRLFGGIGTLNTNGSYALDHATAFDAAAQGPSGMVTSGPFTFRMKAFGAQQPIVLLDTVITDGAIDAPEGITLLESGKISGVFTPENARAVYVPDANLSMFEIFTSLQMAPDVDRDGDGVLESWRWSMTFSTMPVWLF